MPELAEPPTEPISVKVAFAIKQMMDGGPLPKLDAETAAAVMQRVRDKVTLSPGTWFRLYGAIKPKGGAILAHPDLRPNFLQLLESEVIEWCLVNKVPCRILKLKPRQKGSSTFSVAALYHRLSGKRMSGCIIGGSHKQGANLFKMLGIYAEHDRFNPRNPCQVLEGKARWANGSEAVQETAANPEAGRSGTYEALLATEVARWAEEGVANAADVLAGILKCVPYLAGTLVELETTANGASGDFYERWQNAITFDELKAGKDGYVKIFAPWFRFEDSVRDPALEEIGSEEDYTETERELAQRHGLSIEQVAWMRWAIREECKKEFSVFQEDYPFDDVSAFRTSGRRRFNVRILGQMLERAKLYPPAFGNIEPQGSRGARELAEGYVWRSSESEQARVLRWEQPQPGYRYLVSIDPMTGATQTGGKDPDNHAAGVWRAGMMQAGRGWVPPKLVARLIDDWGLWEREKKYALRWDIDVLEEQVWRLAQYFGNCLIVPEVNMDRGLIELLKLRGANLYRRPIWNRVEMIETKAYGFLTQHRNASGGNTREMTIENLARAVREERTDGDGVEIFCPIVLGEMLTVISKQNGSSEAQQGCHDDNVLMAAIGLMCLDGATAYAPRRIERPLPPEMAKLLRAEQAAGGRGGLAMRW